MMHNMIVYDRWQRWQTHTMLTINLSKLSSSIDYNSNDKQNKWVKCLLDATLESENILCFNQIVFIRCNRILYLLVNRWTKASKCLSCFESINFYTHISLSLLPEILLKMRIILDDIKLFHDYLGFHLRMRCRYNNYWFFKIIKRVCNCT